MSHDLPLDRVDAELDEVLPRWQSHGAEGTGEGASFLTYMLIDAAVDTYFPILDSFSDQLEVLEELIFGKFKEDVVEDIFRLKKQTLAMRRLVTPLRDVFLTLLRRDESMFGARTYIYFQDVLDHLLRISDTIDNYRDLVGSAVDAYMSTVSNRTNETMKALTIYAGILLPLTLIAGICGMNIPLPVADKPWSLAVVSGIMVGTTAIL